LTLQTTKRSH